METDLQILMHSPGQLSIVAPPDAFDLATKIFWAVLLLAMGWLTWRLWRVSRWAAIAVVVVACVAALVQFSSHRTSRRLVIDRGANSFAWETFDSGGTLSSQQVKLSDVERADMDFNRTSRRIVVSLHDGRKVYPLGEGFDYKDSQFKALDLIREEIGQTPYAAPARAGGGR
jgi:hypothetical protein